MRACLGALLVLMTGGSGLMAQSFDFTAGTQSFFTESGIPVIFRVPKQEPGPVQEVVSLRISAFGGVELTEKAGALDLLSGLLMRGTYSYSKDQIDDLLTRTGARLSVSADQDSVELSLRCLRRFLPELLPLVSEIVRVPKMEERELKLLIEQQVAALKSEQDRPESVIALKMNQIFFSGHPYQRRPSGYLESIREIKREDLHSLLFRTFNRQNVVVTLVGDFQVEEVKALIDEHFRSLPEGQRTNPTRAIPNNDFSQTHFTSFNSPTTYFLARFKSPALDDEDFPALTIGMQILHNRLFEEVRTNRGLAYSVSAR
ncbi:MAG: insulinase family protein, partial [Bradymonadales bacterium]